MISLVLIPNVGWQSLDDSSQLLLGQRITNLLTLEGIKLDSIQAPPRALALLFKDSKNLTQHVHYSVLIAGEDSLLEKLVNAGQVTLSSLEVSKNKRLILATSNLLHWKLLIGNLIASKDLESEHLAQALGNIFNKIR